MREGNARSRQLLLGCQSKEWLIGTGAPRERALGSRWPLGCCGRLSWLQGLRTCGEAACGCVIGPGAVLSLIDGDVVSVRVCARRFVLETGLLACLGYDRGL